MFVAQGNRSVITDNSYVKHVINNLIAMPNLRQNNADGKVIGSQVIKKLLMLVFRYVCAEVLHKEVKYHNTLTANCEITHKFILF